MAQDNLPDFRSTAIDTLHLIQSGITLDDEIIGFLEAKLELMYYMGKTSVLEERNLEMNKINEGKK